MDLESEDEDDDHKEEEEETDACAEKRRRMFAAICFEIEEEDERKTRNRRRLGEDKDEEVFELKWKRRQLKAHEWRIVRDERGARLEEEEEDKDKMKIKTYFDILVSFLATSGDESLLLRKMWKRVRGNENVLEFVRGLKIKAKDADVLMSAPCRFPFLKDDDDENDGECGFDR